MYTEEELAKTKEELEGRGYTSESVEKFIEALKNDEEYEDAVNYLEPEPEPTPEPPKDDTEKANKEYESMKNLPDRREDKREGVDTSDQYPDLDALYPKMSEHLKGKAPIDPKSKDLNEEYPSMRDLPDKRE